MPFNFSLPEYLSHYRTQKNRVSPVSRASPAHMNSPLVSCDTKKKRMEQLIAKTSVTTCDK